MIRSRLCGSAGLALMMVSLPALAANDSLVTRWQAPAEVEEAGGWQPLTYNLRLDSATRLRTGTRGRLELQLVDRAQLRIGGDSELLVHSTEAPDGLVRRGLARVQLLRGRLRATAGPLDLWPPTDLRLNVGELRLRVFGAEVWAQAGETRDEVCLLHGAVEIRTPQGSERLDGRGDCLVWDGRTTQLLTADAAGPVAARLTALEFAPPQEQPFTVRIAPREPPRPGPAAEATEAMAHAAPAVTESATASWSLVLASVPTREAAEQEVARLRRRGVDTRIVEPAGDGGAYRLTYGAFYTREAAERALRQKRRQRGFEKAWLLQQP